MTQQHTPLPWKFGNTGTDQVMILGGKNGDYVCSVQIQQMGGGVISEAMEPRRRANAKFILRACNAHDDLLNVAIRAETMLPMIGNIPAVQRLLADLASAIAKARGEA